MRNRFFGTLLSVLACLPVQSGVAETSKLQEGFQLADRPHERDFPAGRSWPVDLSEAAVAFVDGQSSRISAGEVKEALCTYNVVWEEVWRRAYHHVGIDRSSGWLILQDGSRLKWFLRPGGLAWVEYPDNSVVYLAAGPPRPAIGVSLEVDPANAAVGEPVRFTARIRNFWKHKASFYLSAIVVRVRYEGDGHDDFVEWIRRSPDKWRAGVHLEDFIVLGPEEERIWTLTTQRVLRPGRWTAHFGVVSDVTADHRGVSLPNLWLGEVEARPVEFEVSSKEGAGPSVRAAQPPGRPVQAPPDKAQATERLEPDRSLDSLLSDLRDPDHHVRAAAAERLGRSRELRAIGPLIGYLKEEPSEMVVGTSALTMMGEPGVEPLIAAFTDDQDRANVTFRAKAARILGNLRDVRAIEPLSNGLKEEERSIFEASMEALAKIGGRQAVQAVISALRLQEPRRRRSAARALGKMKDPHAGHALVVALEDENMEVREVAAVALGELKSVAAVGPLIDALTDLHGRVGEFAALALGEIGDPGSIAPVVAMLSVSREPKVEAKVRQRAFLALGSMGDLALDALLASLQDEEQDLRFRAAATLSRMVQNRFVGYHLKNIQPAVEAVLKFAEEGRADAMRFGERIHLLEGIEDPRAVRLMLNMLRKRDDWYSASSGYQTAPQEFLLLFPRVGEYAVDPLIEALRDEDANVRTGAAEAFLYLPYPKVAPDRVAGPLLAALRDEEPNVRINAIRALRRIKDPRAVSPLLVIAQNKRESPNVRIASLQALTEFVDPRIGVAIENMRSDRTESKEIRELPLSLQEYVRQPLQMAELNRRLRSRSLSERVNAAYILATAGEVEKATRPLLEGLQEEDSSIRLVSLSGLLLLEDPRIVPAVIAMVRSESDVDVRRAAWQLLASRIGVLETAPLIEIMGGTTDIRENRLFSIEMLGEIRKADSVEPLVAVLKSPDEDEEIKKASLMALRKIRKMDLQGLLLFLLDYQDPVLDQFLVQALEKLAGCDYLKDPEGMRDWIKRNEDLLNMD